MKTILIFAVVALGVGTTIAMLVRQNPKQAKVHEQHDTVLGYQMHRLVSEGVVVEFPAPYRTDSVQEDSPYGPVARFGAVAETSNCDYALLVNTYPSSLVEKIGPTQLLNNSITTAVGRMEGIVGKMENGTTDGAPPVRFTFTLRHQKSSGEGIALISGNRVFMISALYATRPDNIDAFFKSLKLEKDAQ